jgi:phage repressor protein C with HTH and peptisase S24 domain
MQEESSKKQGKRLAAARLKAGYRSARDAALSNGWPESTYRAHESGRRTIGQDDAERYARRFRANGAKITAKQILFGDHDEAAGERERKPIVPIMGYIGAGAEIEPEFEQVPLDGFDQVELPFALDDDVIALQVKGDSMLPIYNDGDVVIVRTDPRVPIDRLVGDEAAVRTYDGKRYLKHLIPGTKRHTYTLVSANAEPMLDQRLAWASEIIAIVPARQTRHLGRSRRAMPRSSNRPAGGGRKER